MDKYIGGIDGAARIVLGLVLIALVFVGPQTPWGCICTCSTGQPV